MQMQTPGQTGRGAIYHGGIGAEPVADAPVESATKAPEIAKRGGGGRRWFLGLALGMAGAMSPDLGMAQTVAAKSPQAASAPAAADPMDALRERIIANLKTGKTSESSSPYTVRVITKPAIVNIKAAARPVAKQLSNTTPPITKGDVMSEARMDELDNNKKLIYGVDGDKERLLSENHTAGMEMPVEKIKQYIDEIVSRASNTKHGVHMQEHENAMWVIDYFNQTKTTDSRVLYYPSKVGDDSPFVQAFKKANKGKPGYEERKVNVPTKDGFKEITVYMNERTDTLGTLPKERAVRAAVDVGTAYVILPKGAQIIERIETISGKEVKKYLIADCGNEIFQALSECPPAGALPSSK